MRRSLAVASTVLLSLPVLIGWPGAASAAEVEIDSPAEVLVGEETTVTVTIVDSDGAPVVGGEVALSFVGRLGGESGWVVVATGTTGEQGSVTLTYLQRAVEAGRMRVEYFGPDGQENTEFEVEVVDGPQQVASDAGADIPILGVWWIIVVLAIIWSLVLLAVLRLVVVGRSSDLSTGPAKVVPGIMVSFVALTAAGMFVVVLTKPQSHANLDPTADFDRVPRAVIGVDDDFNGLGLGDPGDDRDGLDGRQLFVRAGCASCHGLDGRGALVGGEIEPRSLGSLVDEVRDGPKGMPAYGELHLTDDEVEEIFAYLEGVSAS